MVHPTSEPSLDDLRTLIAVARTGRLVSAATHLGIDHTTVRRRLDRLEAALGARLLDRTREGWELTGLGREVVARAGVVDEVVERVREAVAGERSAVRGTVRVLAPEAFALAYATPALARLRRSSPGVVIELETTTRELGVHAAGFDLAVTVGPPAGSRLVSEVLVPYVLRLYAAPDYLETHGPLRTPADLAGHPLVFYVDALLAVRELDLAPLLGGMRLGFGATSASAQVEATRRGAGIGLLHSFAAEDDPGLIPVLPDQVEFPLQFSLSMRRESGAVPAVALAREAIVDEVRRRSREFRP